MALANSCRVIFKGKRNYSDKISPGCVGLRWIGTRTIFLLKRNTVSPLRGNQRLESERRLRKAPLESCGGWTRTSDLKVMRGNLRPHNCGPQGHPILGSLAVFDGSIEDRIVAWKYLQVTIFRENYNPISGCEKTLRSSVRG